MYNTPLRCPTCGHAEKRPTRSIQQNRYMWGVVYKILSNHLGYTIDEIHELMKHKFLGRTLSIEDEVFNIPTSTAELDTKQMEDYLNQIRQWAFVKLGCNIPEPSEIDLVVSG